MKRKNMLGIKLVYPELSLLRDLLKEKQMQLWKSKWLPRLKGKSDIEIRLAFLEVIAEPKYNPMPYTEEHFCHHILRELQKCEDRIKNQLNLNRNQKGRVK